MQTSIFFISNVLTLARIIKSLAKGTIKRVGVKTKAHGGVFRWTEKACCYSMGEGRNRYWLCRSLFLFLFSFRADCERVGREGHDRGCLPGHRGHEVRLAFLREVRELPGGGPKKLTIFFFPKKRCRTKSCTKQPGLLDFPTPKMIQV